MAEVDKEPREYSEHEKRARAARTEDPASGLIAFDEDGDLIEPKEVNLEAWEVASKSACIPRMKRAMLRVAGGASYTEAARSEGYLTHSRLFRMCVKYGIANISTRSLVNDHREVAHLASAEIMRRLTETPDDWENRDLVVAGGVSTDKVLAHEKSTTDDGGTYLSKLEIAARELVESGASLEISVSIKPADSDLGEISVGDNSVHGDSVHRGNSPDVVDVTPSPTAPPELGGR